MLLQIGEIAEQIPHIPRNSKCEFVDHIFKSNPRLQGVVVYDNGHPIALIMRIRFYQQIGTLYGYTLFMGRSIELLMDKHPLVVQYKTAITEVSKLAMNRKEENLYDYVIVTHEGQLFGAVSVRDLLLNFAEIQAVAASFLNPLTGLPGNLSISEWLVKSLLQDQFSVLYIDLDHFKAYNDTYGFKEGDRMLQSTAEILKHCTLRLGGFLGHIGGDDFIIFLKDYNYLESCKTIIREFETMVKSFYHEQHLVQRYVLTESRSGKMEEIPLVSISVAVVTNRSRKFDSIEDISGEAARIKKKCKKIKGCCYIDDMDVVCQVKGLEA
ncbi:GGDEF domain-containing protein [Paenibacillus wynnii]|uniref:GGDEF domain-containing protein n=1 Tax=Paenibacillus wynnii TaxID=268407 RepID=UPI00279499F7|nr:GGDEF domain-containing protein [Paenibacillus wynnii]MDQ0193149.1 diguanylate cyclase (GGDEF)-like protein [Paenibacillus wynnii]